VINTLIDTTLAKDRDFVTWRTDQAPNVVADPTPSVVADPALPRTSERSR
jgi:hypothetical protein